MADYPFIRTINGKKYFYRFTVNQRIQHAILAVSVVVLVLTGMPLKFHDASWAPYLYSMFGGIHAAPIVHKIFGSILVILFIFHVFYHSPNKTMGVLSIRVSELVYQDMKTKSHFFYNSIYVFFFTYNTKYLYLNNQIYFLQAAKGLLYKNLLFQIN